MIIMVNLLWSIVDRLPSSYACVALISAAKQASLTGAWRFDRQPPTSVPLVSETSFPCLGNNGSQNMLPVEDQAFSLLYRTDRARKSARVVPSDGFLLFLRWNVHDLLGRHPNSDFEADSTFDQSIILTQWISLRILAFALSHLIVERSLHDSESFVIPRLWAY